ncbi:MAG: DUF3387 domain-containing protein [Methylotenera sp.]|nr:DUF3387 domain-containing protein [Methylotenera sp.]
MAWFLLLVAVNNGEITDKRDDIKSALKVGLILLLDEFGYPPVERDEVYMEIFEQAENFKKYSSA